MPVLAHINPLSVAPMVDHTDRHCRFLLRLIAPTATLYTEMIVADGIVRGNALRLLAFSPREHPLIAQLAGADPSMLADATQIVEDFGYDAVNLNVGCPSKRVVNGGFGAFLMEQPERVFSVIRAMKNVSTIPITVKCRLGTDRVNGYPTLLDFVKGLAECGVDGVVVHARIADLSGASTVYNLNIPPLDWRMVERLQNDLPHLPITLNGGLSSLDDVKCVRSLIKRLMIGRLALKRPDLLAQIHAFLYDAPYSYSPFDVSRTYREYIVGQLDQGVPLQAMTRHMLSLFHHYSGAKRFRQHLSDFSPRRGATIEVLDEAIASIANRQMRHLKLEGDFGVAA